MAAKKEHTVLFGILDWGLGHATRSVPIIRKLLAEGIDVVLVSENRPKAFLEKEFPDLKIIAIPSFQITYSRRIPMALKILMHAPKILHSIKKEHAVLEKIIEECSIDAVISDNRYGLWSKKIPSIIVTHQLNLQVPAILSFAKPLLNWFIHRQLSNFDQLWIPDFEDGFRISGKLSEDPRSRHKKKFIGLLSRFDKNNICTEIIYDLLVILSGPEPQRTILEKKVIEQLQATDFKIAIVQGKTEIEGINKIYKNIEIYSHLPSKELEHLICSSRQILSRSGYSTIMDLLCLGKSAFFIPTPGQTEQEYLAAYYGEQKLFRFSSQKEFDIYKVFNSGEAIQTKKIIFAHNLLDDAIKNLIESLNKC